MTAHRRTQLLLAAAAVCLLFPACVTFQSRPVPITSPEERDRMQAEMKQLLTVKAQSEFKVYPSLPTRPGETVAIQPPLKDSATTTQKPTAEPDEVPVPHSTVAAMTITSTSPGLFPPLRPPSTIRPWTPPGESAILAAVQAYIEGRQDRAIDALKPLQPPNQELVLAVLPILARGATIDVASDPVAVAVLAEQLHAAAAQLEHLAALRIENMALCRKVSGFGRYDPWPQGQPYRPNDQAQLYLEIRHLVSQPEVGPQGETHLTQTLTTVEVRDAHGRFVEQPARENWKQLVPVVRFETKRYTRGPIRDFHLLYPFPVPTTPGVYTVAVEVRDPTSRRVVRSAPMEFRVAGP